MTPTSSVQPAAMPAPASVPGLAALVVGAAPAGGAFAAWLLSTEVDATLPADGALGEALPAVVPALPLPAGLPLDGPGRAALVETRMGDLPAPVALRLPLDGSDRAVLAAPQLADLANQVVVQLPLNGSGRLAADRLERPAPSLPRPDDRLTGDTVPDEAAVAVAQLMPLGGVSTLPLPLAIAMAAAPAIDLPSHDAPAQSSRPSAPTGAALPRDLAASLTLAPGAPVRALSESGSAAAARPSPAMLMPSASLIPLAQPVLARPTGAAPPRPAPDKTGAQPAGSQLLASVTQPASRGVELAVTPAAALPARATASAEVPAITLLSATPQDIASGDTPSTAPTAWTATPPVNGATSSPPAPLSLGDTTAPAAWRSPLLHALNERVQLQLAQRSEHALIRLDPPDHGRVEIVLRHEAGTLQVQLSATHADVQRQLLHIADALRQDLSQRQYGEVSVQVAAHPGDADGRSRQSPQQRGHERDERPGQALADAERGPAAQAFSLASGAE